MWEWGAMKWIGRKREEGEREGWRKRRGRKMEREGEGGREISEVCFVSGATNNSILKNCLSSLLFGIHFDTIRTKAALSQEP